MESKNMKETIRFTLNGKPVELEVEGDRMLLWVLRTELGLTGTKHGCGDDHCGACTVLINKNAVRSCAFPVSAVQGKNVTTIEGLADLESDSLDPIQDAFVQNSGMQCGFCTPGMIITAKALLEENPSPSEADVREAISGNLCRCGNYNRITESIMSAADLIYGGA